MFNNIIFNLKILTIGMIFSLGIFHLLVSIGREKIQKQKNISFALMLYSILAYLIVIDNNYKNIIIKYFGESIGYILSISISGFMVICFIRFIIYTFELEEKSKDVSIFIINYIIYIILADSINLFDIIFKTDIYKKLRFFSILYLIILCFFGLTLCTIRIIKEKKIKYIIFNKSIYFIGYIVLLLILFLNPLSFLIIPLRLITTSLVGFLIVFFIFSFALAKDFTKEHKDLIILKLTLEQKVHDRTRQLEKAKKSIEQKEKQKTSFFINLAHETKTPLTLISNYLERYISRVAQDEDLSVIKTNVDKLQKDMINFLDAEKLERAQIFYNHDYIIDLYRFLLDKIKVFKETAKNNNVKIQFILDRDIYIKIDPYALDRIINNLLDNAIKYNKANGKIEIILRYENKNASIIIKDTGIGISKDQIKNIFNPYYQLSHRKRNIQGIGMGLNIVKKILNQVKGKINIESEVNKGTEVYVTMPVQENINPGRIINEFNQIKNIVSKKVKHDLEDIYDENKRFSILFVEDNLDMLSFLKENLKDNYNIFLAKNGNEALKKINSIPRQIDLVISDIMMDEMDGYEFYNKYIEIDNLNKSIPFIFLTAKSKHDEKIKGLKLGAVDYIYKPFDITELIAKIESFIGLNEAKNVYLFVKQDEILQNNLEHWFYKKYKITDKEREVINCIINGDMNKEIAYKIDVSEGTIKNYILEIYKKVDVTNRIGLFRKIIRMR